MFSGGNIPSRLRAHRGVGLDGVQPQTIIKVNVRQDGWQASIRCSLGFIVPLKVEQVGNDVNG